MCMYNGFKQSWFANLDVVILLTVVCVIYNYFYRKYNNYYEGEFILYKHTTKPYEVYTIDMIKINIQYPYEVYTIDMIKINI